MSGVTDTYGLPYPGGDDDFDVWQDIQAFAEAVDAALAIAAGGGTPAVVNTDFDAKGDLLVGTGDGTYQKVTVGTNGKVLTAASGQTAGVQWATPTAAVVPGDFNVKGDILVGTGDGTYVQVGVGTNGDILVADSGEAAGVKWDAPPEVPEAGIVVQTSWEATPTTVSADTTSNYPGEDMEGYQILDDVTVTLAEPGFVEAIFAMLVGSEGSNTSTRIKVVLLDQFSGDLIEKIGDANYTTIDNAGGAVSAFGTAEYTFYSALATAIGVVANSPTVYHPQSKVIGPLPAGAYRLAIAITCDGDAGESWTIDDRLLKAWGV